MFSYIVINTDLGELEHVLGTQEAISKYDAQAKLESSIMEEFPADNNWVLKSLVINEDPVEYITELA